MKRTIAAAIFALLAVTASAHAATVDFDYSVNLDFPAYTRGGTPITNVMYGIVDFSLNPSNGDYYIDGSQDLSMGGAFFIEPGDSNTPPVSTAPFFVNGSSTVFPGLYSFSVNTGTFPNLNFSDFMFSGQQAVGGTVTACPSSGACAVTPLPAAFPLFGSALAGLGGFGWLTRRGKVSRTQRG
jgi:hypothetical protein